MGKIERFLWNFCRTEPSLNLLSNALCHKRLKSAHDNTACNKLPHFAWKPCAMANSQLEKLRKYHFYNRTRCEKVDTTAVKHVKHWQTVALELQFVAKWRCKNNRRYCWAELEINRWQKLHLQKSGKWLQKWLRNVKSNWAMKGFRQLLKTFCAVTSTLSNQRQANKIHRQNLLEFACNQQKKGKRWFSHCVFPVWRIWTRNYFLVLNTKVVVLKNCWPALRTEVG